MDELTDKNKYIQILLVIASMASEYEQMERGNQSAAKRIRKKIRSLIILLKNERNRILELSKN